MKAFLLTVLLCVLFGCVQQGSQPIASPLPSVAVSPAPSAVSPSVAASPTPTPVVSVPVAASPAIECVSDSDCVAGGCSGQVCQAKSSEPAITTCEWSDEYACFQPSLCGCDAGRCGWGKEARDCVSAVRSGGVGALAEKKCVDLCKEYAANGSALESGPCLSNQIAPDWVCDVAHLPRQEQDNNPANTCPSFGSAASHFVEVDSSCKVVVVDGTPV